MSLRYVDANASSPALAWYLRLVPEGYQGDCRYAVEAGEVKEPEDDYIRTLCQLTSKLRKLKPVVTGIEEQN